MKKIDSMNDSSENKKEKMLNMIQEYHAEQTRNAGKDPYWKHCQTVSEIIYKAFIQSKELEGDVDLLIDIKLAAMGHDLIEDTVINKNDIEVEFGKRVANLIDDLTNEEGDHDRAAYLEKITNASEEAKLIKLADMIENCTSVGNNFEDLGYEWVTTFFLPIITEMKGNIQIADFTKYRKTAEILLVQLDNAYKNLYNKTEINNNNNMNPKIESSNERDGERHEDETAEEFTERVEREAAKTHAAAMKKNAQLLEEAKNNADENKEPFNLDELKEYYSFASDFVPLNIPQTISKAEIERIESIYYLDYPKIKTMEELGEFLTKLDAYG